MKALQGERIYTVMVRFEVVGMHCWPKAPAAQYYLRNDHRHLFKFKVELQAEHADRAIEIHTLKARCQYWANQKLVGRVVIESCENLAELLLHNLQRDFNPLWGKVECWEDGECGGSCEMSWPKEDTLGAR